MSDINPRRSKRELILVAFIVMAGLAGLAAFLALRDQAFPYASIDFRVSRPEAKARAYELLRARHYDLKGFSSAITFDHDSEAKDFLEKTIGLERANKLMRDRIAVWNWTVRYYKPASRHQYYVYVSPTGKILGWSHLMPEEAKGPRLRESDALEIARNSLKKEAGIDVSTYKLVEHSSEDRPKRRDHSFEWRDPSRHVGDAEYRISAGVKGDEVSGFSQYLKVPEKFTETMDKEASKGGLLYSMAAVPSAILGIGALVWFVVAVINRRMKWKFALFTGGAIALVVLAASANSIPLTKSYYYPMDSYGGFIARQIAFAIVGAISAGLGIMFLAATGGDIYARVFRDRRPLDRAFSLNGLLSREFAIATVVGYALAAYHLGYVTVFYIGAKKYLNAWVPAEIPYDDTLSTAIPWIYPLLIGLSAALSEEFVFRLFGISFLKRFLKSTWIAVIIPGVTWAFLHSNYPQQPYYIRGIEIGIHSIILGWVFVRFGIFSTIIAHYVYNAVLGSMLLFRSSSPYFLASGAVVVLLMLAPLMVAAAASLLPALRERRRLADAEVETEPEPAPLPPALIEPPPLEYTPLPRRTVVRLTILGLAAFAIVLGLARPMKRPEFDVKIDRPQAYRLAEKHLEKQGVSPKGYVSWTSFSVEAGGTPDDYVLRTAGREAIDRLYQTALPPALWTTTWQRPLKEDSYSVSITRLGRVYGWYHETYEDTPGANLSQADALRLAEAYLKEHGRNLSLYKLVSKDSEKWKKRTDHWFTWERKDIKFKKARIRTNLTVQGDKVYGLSDYIKIPEKYFEEENKQTLKDGVLGIVLIVAAAAFGLWAAILFMIGCARRKINWRFAITIGFVGMLLDLISTLNDLPRRYAGFGSTESLASFNYQYIQSAILGLIPTFVAGVFVAGLADFLYRETFPNQPPLISWYRAIISWRSKGALALRQGLGLAVVAFALGAGIAVPIEKLHGAPSIMKHAVYSPGIPASEIDSALPVLSDIEAMLGVTTLGILGMAAVVCIAVRVYRKRPWFVGSAILALILISAGASAKSWSEFGILSAAGLIGTAGAIWVLSITRHNIATYLIAGLLTVGGGVELAHYSNTFLRANGVISLILMLAVPAWILLTSWGVKDERIESSVPEFDL